LADMIRQWRRNDQEGHKPSVICADILAGVGFSDWLLKNNDPIQAQTRQENIAELLNAIELWEDEQEAPTLAAYLENVALINDDHVDNAAQSRVTLMTIHRAKGLEFDEVFLVGLEEGLFPGKRSYEKPDLLEEERRLCYVGMTRARQKLHMSACRMRRLYGQTMDNRPSRFLMEIPLELLKREDSKGRDAQTGSGRERGARKHAASVPQAGFKRQPRYLQKSVAAAGKRDSGENRNSVKSSVQSSDTKDAASFPQGCRVEHSVFGPGVVAGVKGSGENVKLDIVFRDRGRKLLALKIASLKRLS